MEKLILEKGFPTLYADGFTQLVSPMNVGNWEAADYKWIAVIANGCASLQLNVRN